MNGTPRTVLYPLLAAAAFSMAAQSASADLYWDTSASSGLTAGAGTWDLNNTANWATTQSPGTASPGVWTDGNIADFYTNAGTTNTVTISGNVRAAGIQQYYATTNISGGTLTLAVSAGNAITNNGTMTIGSTLLLSDPSGSYNRSYVYNTGSVLITGTVADAVTGVSPTLRVAGTGTTTLGGANTFSGGIQIETGGIINLTHSAGAGTGSILFGKASTNESGQQLVLTLTSPGTVSKNLLFAAGNLTSPILIKSNGAGAATMGGSILFSGQPGNSGLAANQGALTLSLGGTSVAANTFAGKIIDAGGGAANITSLAKQDAGTWILTAANTYTGTTTISGGNLILGAANTLASATGSVTVSGGTLSSNVAGASLGGNLILASGAIDTNGSTGVGSLTLSAGKNFTLSGGTLVVTIAGASSFDQIIGSGTLSLSGGTIDLLNSSQIDYTQSYQIFSGFTAAGTFVAPSIVNYDTTDWMATIDQTGRLTFAPVTVPEPASLLSLAAGAGFLTLSRLKKAR